MERAMKCKGLRIAVNAIAAILILLSRLVFRVHRKIIYFDVSNGVSIYRTTYYILGFIPVYTRKDTIPRLKDYVGKDK